MIRWFQRTAKRLLGIREATFADIFGVPQAPIDDPLRRNMSGLWAVDPYRDKLATIRTHNELDRVRTICRALYESNPTGAGVPERIADFSIGKGSSVDVQSVDEGEEPPKRLTADVKRILKQFKLLNEWPELEAELVVRLVVDGEAFIRLFPQDDTTQVRFIEPQFVRPPMGESHTGPWSWGIRTKEGDSATPEEYCIHDFISGTDEIVDAMFVIHAKATGFRNQKRALPMLWACSEEIRGAERLRYVAREGLKAREAVSYFRVHEAANQSSITSLQDANASGTYDRTNADGSIQTVVYEQQPPGQVVDIPKSLQPAPPPSSPNGEATSRQVAMANEAVAARLGVPVWVVSGASDSSNFAASLTAESPFARSLERWQDRLSRWVDCILTKVIEIACEQELLPEDTLERIDLLVSFPSPIMRNKKEETDRRKVLRDNSIISESTWRSEEGYDEKELAIMAKERQDGIGQLPTAIKATETLPTPSGTNGALYNRLINRPEN